MTRDELIKKYEEQIERLQVSLYIADNALKAHEKNPSEQTVAELNAALQLMQASKAEAQEWLA